MLPLIPIALSLLPDLARWLVGPKAESIAQTVSTTVAATIGSDDPATVAATLADPARAAELRIRLAEIAAQAEAAQAQARLDEMRAVLADVQSARSTTVALAQSGSPIAWGAPIVSGILMLGFFAAFGMLIFGSPPTDANTAAMLNILVGSLGAGFVSVTSYWLGSSAGSARKDAMLAASPPALPPPASAADALNERELSRLRGR